jgi:hypothetical protein
MRARATIPVIALLIGCGGNSRPAPPATTATIGPLGGVMQMPGGPTLAVVPDALAADTQITIRARSSGASGALSTVYDFEPQGLAFARPATLSIPVDPSVTSASIVLTQANDTAAAETLPAMVDNGVASAQITRLMSGFAAPFSGKTRTVSGTFATVYWADDDSRTTIAGFPGAPVAVTAAWVPAGSNYRRIPASTAPHPVGNFSIDGVPEGPYFLEIDTMYPATLVNAGGTVVALYELTTSTPDLSVVVSGRPDMEIESSKTSLTLRVDNLTPWTRPASGFTGDQLLVAGSQSSVYGRPFTIGAAPPVAGATTWTGTFDWKLMSTAQVIGLPDASKGDVEFVYQRSTSPIGNGATSGAKHIAARFARLDTLTLHDGQTASAAVTLTDAPQTGALRANLRNSRWATLLTDSNPASVPQGAQGVSLLAIPHSITFPDQPGLAASTSLAYIQAPGLLDVDYGTVPYGQFLGPLWKEVRYVVYITQADVPQPGTSTPFTSSGFFSSMEPMPADDEIVPVLGPPRSPKIEGRDAFQAQTGVGLHPTVSWSPPRLGSATSYTVNILAVSGNPAIANVSLTVYGVTSLQIPTGILQAGATYNMIITANSAPWDSLDRPPFRQGIPTATADCVTAVFAP